MLSSLGQDGKTFVRLLTYMQPYRGKFVVALVSSLPVAAMNGALAWAVGPLLDNILKNHDYSILLLIPVAIIGAAIVQSLCEYVSNYYTNWVGTSICRDIRQALYERLALMELPYFKAHTSSHLLTRYFIDPAMLQQAIVTNLQGFIIEFFNLFVLAGVLFSRDAGFAVLALGVISLIVIPLNFISKKVRALDHELAQATAKINKAFRELIDGIQDVKSFRLERYQQKYYTKKLEDHFGFTVRISKTSNLLSPLMHVIASVGISAIVLLGGHRVMDGAMTPGDLSSFLLALVLLYKPVKVVGGIIGKFQRIMAPAERVFEKLDLPVAEDPKGAVELADFESLAFENVTFAYEADKPVLRNVDLTVRKGQKIALVGPSGSGKSTMVALAGRFFRTQPGNGQILLNGQDINRVSNLSIREMMAYVSQDPFLFEGTLAENIRLGNLKATDAQVLAAAQAANLQPLIDNLKDGLDTYIGERGALLSGGQRQRVAIARAFLKNSPLLILDEATSALDNQSEALVQDAIDRLMADKTVILIAHRLSTVEFCDQIVVFEDGKIAEQGTHEELLAVDGGLYHTLYHLQFRKRRPSKDEILTTEALLSIF